MSSSVQPLEWQPPSKIKHWCVTDPMKTYVSQTWTINNFKMYCEKMEHGLSSSDFQSRGEGVPECVWCLTLNPIGADEEGYFMSLFLELKSCSKPEVYISFTLSIISPLFENYSRVMNHCIFYNKSEEGFEDFIQRDKVLNSKYGFIADGKLKVHCEIFFMEDPSHMTGVNNLIEVPKASWSTDLARLYDIKEFSDVILQARNGREFHAHKCILWARCPVFEHMFQVNMKENIENRVELDMSDEVLESVLCHLYKDEFKPVDKMDELLKVAEMYDLGRLKTLCEMELSSKLTVDTVVDILQLADTHRADHLRQRAVDFVVQNIKGVWQTTGWNALMSRMSEFISAILQKFASSQPIVFKSAPN